jgi:hypothetical protein
MREMSDPEEVGGETIRIGDCFVWSEIYYLDSPTDYCEYIPNKKPSSARIEGCSRTELRLGPKTD